MVGDDELQRVAAESYSVSDLMKRLGLVPMGGNHQRYKERVRRLGISFPKRQQPYQQCPPLPAKPLDKHLALNGLHINTTRLKRRLIAAGLKENCCEICRLGPMWMGQPLTLQLDHINGNRADCRIDNLRILCPNCHTQTPTHGIIKPENRAKKSIKAVRPPRKLRLCLCGAIIRKRNKTKLCRKCYGLKFPPPRKVSNRPPLDVLLQEINSFGYKEVGRKYGVSDNAVRKWIKAVLPL